MSSDLIAAVATPAGSGGIGIVRVSGATVAPLAAALSTACLPPPRLAQHCRFIDADGDIIDDGLALYFPAPASFTGEAVLELHAHGGVFVMQRLLARCLQLGARAAEPGEFTLRAYLNNKLDLAQAEALADLINAGSNAAAAAAARSLTGAFSLAVGQFTQQLRRVRVMLESDLDFSDEDAQTPDFDATRVQLQTLQDDLANLINDTKQGARLTSGVDIVIIGAPNVGKSSLLNCLADEEAAIVSAEAGTTRDLIERQIIINGLAACITDTAGLRDSTAAVEQEGMRRAQQRLARADIIVQVSSADSDAVTLPAHNASVVKVHNKIDLSGEAAGEQAGVYYISAKTGDGVQALRQGVCDAAGYTPVTCAFSARSRHVAALQAAQSRLHEATQAALPEVAAAWLGEADNYLQSITGTYNEEDLLADIFSTFCIGK